MINDNVRIQFYVYVEGNQVPVLNLPVDHHGMNGGVKSWWMYYKNIQASDYESRLKEILSGKVKPWEAEKWDYEKDGFHPYESKIVPRISWEVNYKQNTTTKHKWNSLRFNTTGVCTIKANGKDFYQFHSHDMSYALSKAQSLMVELTEHPYNFLNPSEEKGRKIYYKGLPATIQPKTYRPWEISIIPDITDTGYTLDSWWDEYMEVELKSEKTKEDREWVRDSILESKNYGSITWGSAFSDSDIKWFR